MISVFLLSRQIRSRRRRTGGYRVVTQSWGIRRAWPPGSQ